jgi:hypothetical protein
MSEIEALMKEVNAMKEADSNKIQDISTRHTHLMVKVSAAGIKLQEAGAKHGLDMNAILEGR